MILKIHLIISVLAYIFFWLTMCRVIEIYKNKNKDKKFENNKLGLTMHLRVIIIALIPLVNVLFLIVFTYLFCFNNDEKLFKFITNK